jgi:hypothetical protein
MGAAIDVGLERADVTVETVDSVFMTGGTSNVPAVRRLFEQRFGRAKLRYGDAFNLVASSSLDFKDGAHFEYVAEDDSIEGQISVDAQGRCFFRAHDEMCPLPPATAQRRWTPFVAVQLIDNILKWVFA